MFRAFFLWAVLVGILHGQSQLWYFTTKGCPACLRMEKEVLGKPEMALYKVRTFRAENDNLPLSVELFPTFVLLDEHGKELHRLVGAYSLPHFLNRLSLASKDQWHHLNQYAEDSLGNASFAMRYMLAMADRAGLTDSLFSENLPEDVEVWAKEDVFLPWVNAFLYPSSGPAISEGSGLWHYVLKNPRYWPARPGDAEKLGLRMRFLLDLFEVHQKTGTQVWKSMEALMASMPNQGTFVLADMDAVVLQLYLMPNKAHLALLLRYSMVGDARLVSLWEAGVREEQNPSFLSLGHDGRLRVVK